MDRRTFIGGGLLGGALLFLGGGSFVALRRGPQVAPPKPLRALSGAGFSVLVAVVARMVEQPGMDAASVAWRVDAALSHAPRRVQRDVNRALLLLNNGLLGLLLRGSTTPFSALVPAAQIRALEAWRDASIALLRQAFQGLRRLSLAAYYADADTWPAIGYGGPLFVKPTLAMAPREALSPPYRPRGDARPGDAP